MPPEPSFPTTAADGDPSSTASPDAVANGDLTPAPTDEAGDILLGGSGIDVLDLSTLTQHWTIAIDGGPTITPVNAPGQYEDPSGTAGTITIDGAGMLRFQDIERITW